MDYYYDLFKTIGTLSSELYHLLAATETDMLIKWMCLAYLGISLFSFICIIGMYFEGCSPKYGTVNFWVVISICTFGIGAIVFKCIDFLMKSPRVFKRPKTQWANLFLPTLTTVFCYFLYQTKLFAPLNGNIILSELAGLIVIIYLVFEDFITNSNKSINFEIPNNPKVGPLLEILSSSLAKRERALSKSALIYEFRGDQIPLKHITSKELTQYLLLKEEDADCIYKEYLRYDGSTFRVAELESLYIPKLYDCLTALLIWLMVTTPYFSGVLEHINSFLR